MGGIDKCTPASMTKLPSSLLGTDVWGHTFVKVPTMGPVCADNNLPSPNLLDDI